MAPWTSKAAGLGSPVGRVTTEPRWTAAGPRVVSGTLWHGIFENDEFRQSYLAEIARLAGCGFVPVGGTCFAAARQAQFDTLADAIATSLDTESFLRLIEDGTSRSRPVVRARI